MHHLVLPPTVWGFMLIHDWQEHRARVLTDSGSSNVRRSKCSSSCYDITSATLDYFLKHTWKPRGKWAWIISHMDYDHYSITLRLIKTRQWHKPELVILPALYSSRACREALATIHMLASLLATALEIPRPLSSDLISIIRNVRRIGVGRGVKLRTGELAYHIIWPPPPGKVGSRCKTLLRRLTEKLEKAKRACVRRRGKKECEEAWSVGEREAGDIIEIMAPEDIYNENESIDLDKLLLTNGEPGTSWDTEDKEHYFQKGVERPVYDYRYIYYFASREFRDRELSRLYGSIINDFSIAYALERNQYPNNYLIPVEMKVKEFRPSTVLIEYSPVEIFLWSHIPLLYLSDLENALSPAIDYYKQYYLHHVKTSYIDVGIEIAAHHGNSYSPKLKDILPKILFLPRCYEHVPQHYTQNYRYRWRYINLPCVQRMYSMHNCGLEAENIFLNINKQIKIIFNRSCFSQYIEVAAHNKARRAPLSEFDQLISYYDDNAWKRYFSIDLAELYRSVKGLLALREELHKRLTSDTVGNLISRSETYRAILLGGFRPDVKQPFTENSLALFYKKIFGIGISDEDLLKTITRLREGDSIEEASLDINVKVEDTPVITRLQKLQAKLELIYTSLKGVIERPESKNYNPEDPLAGVKALGEALNAGKKILPLYNPLSFFIMSIYSVPRFYIKEIYHELFNDKTRQVLEKYDIKIVKLLEPELTNERLREERQIIGLKRGSVGSYIREIIFDLYGLFKEEILYRFYNNIEDELVKYITEYINKIRESIVSTQFTDVINKVKSRGNCYDRGKYTACYSRYSAKVSGGSVDLRDITRSGYIVSTKINYTEFFACLAPQMFSGLAYIEPVSEDSQEFNWMCLLGWESD